MKIIISDKKVKIIDKEKLRTGNVNTYLIDVEYSDVYKDRALNLYFKNGDIKKIEQVGPNNVVKIPHEVLEKTGLLFIGIFSPNCKDNTLIDRYCSNLDTLEVTEGAYDKDATYTEELSPSILEQYLQEMKDFYNESIKEYNENALLETNKFNTNADNRKKEIDAVALNVEEDKKAVENMQEDIINRQEAVKSSENNAKTSEQNARNSVENSSQILTNVTTIQEDINSSKAHIDRQTESIDKSVDDVEKLVEEATIQANISKEQAELSTTKAGQVSADKNAVESMKNEVSSMKTSVEQTKADAEQIKADTQTIKEDTVALKDETLEAKTEVENSLENERNENDKKYARAIESDEIVIDGYGQVELDEDGYMKEFSAEANLPDITQKTRSGINLYNVKDVKRKNDEVTIDENDFITMTADNTGGNSTIYKNYCTKYSDRFEPNHEYFLVAEILEVEGSGRISFSSNHDSDKPQFVTSVYRDFNTLSAGQKIIASIYTGENNWMGLRSFATFFSGQSGSIKYRISILKYEPIEENFEYEPYGASPSLDYPSQFENVVKNVEMKLLKNNLSNFTTESTGAILGTSWVGLDFEIINNYTSKISGKPTVDEYRVGGPYNSTNVLIPIDYKKNYCIYNNLNLRMGVTLVQKDGTYRQLSLDNKELLSLTENDIGISSLRISVNTKIEYKNTILRYIVCEAIEENELALSEGQFLGNFKGYKNYIKDNKLLKSLVKVKLNGTEDWELKNVKEKTQVFFWNLQKKIVPNIGFCNYLKFNAPGDVEKYTPVEGGIYISINKSTASTVEELKNLLSSLYNSGNAMTFIYAIPTPEKEELSTEIKSKINSLKVYNGINNIYSNCKISFKANKNLNNYIKNKIDKSMAENNKTERKTSDNKYSKALKDKIVDKSFVQVYADNPKTDNLAIKGEQLKQRVRQGYNLLKYPYVSTNKTQHGVAITDNGDGSITLNGTSTEEIRFGYQLENNLPNDYYTYITYGLPDTCYTNYFNIGDIYGQRVANFDKTATTETVNLGAQLVIPKGVTLNNITIYPMLVKGQYTRETIPVWEQYGASPSFEFPSEIKETSEQNIEVCKKNLAHTNNVSTDNGYINTTNAKIGKVKANKEHIISFNCSSEHEGTNQIQSRNIYLDNTYEVLGNIKFSSGNRVSLVFTPQYDGEVYLSANFGIAYENILSGIQIEYGNIATEFEPYEGNEYNAVLPEGQFNGAIGEYSDKIYAAGKQDKVIQRLVLDGTENISTSSNGNIFRFRPEIEPIVNNTSGLKTNAIMSNAFSNMSFDNLYNANVENGIEIYNGLIQFRDSTINSVDDCKTKFKELYDAGTPVIIYYVTNAVSVDLPEGTVPKIELMDGLNNISIDKGTMSFEYNKSLARAFEEEREEKEDLKTRVSNLENQILELLGGN